MAEVICFDIDGVLTEEAGVNHRDLAGSYIYQKPRRRAKELCLRCYDAGLTVILFTGRREAQRRITEDWLHAHGFHYHYLFMGKPYFTWVIDDRVMGATVDQQLGALEGYLDEGERPADISPETWGWVMDVFREQRERRERYGEASETTKGEGAEGNGGAPESGEPSMGQASGG